MIRGKQAVIGLLAFLGIMASLFGPQFLYHYSESGIEYDIFLESFNQNGDMITGSVRLRITNTNDFSVSVTHISLMLFNPAKDTPFYSTTDQGASLGAGSVIYVSKSFEIRYSEIPEYEVRVQLSAYVVWNGQDDWMSKEFFVPIEWG